MLQQQAVRKVSPIFQSDISALKKVEIFQRFFFFPLRSFDFFKRNRAEQCDQQIGRFWKFSATNSLSKVAQKDCRFLGYFEKAQLMSKLRWIYFRQLVEPLGKFLPQHLVTLEPMPEPKFETFKRCQDEGKNRSFKISWKNCCCDVVVMLLLLFFLELL